MQYCAKYSAAHIEEKCNDKCSCINKILRAVPEFIMKGWWTVTFSEPPTHADMKGGILWISIIMDYTCPWELGGTPTSMTNSMPAPSGHKLAAHSPRQIL